MPLIILFILNLEACLDKLATIVLVGDKLGIAEVGVLRDECLFLEVLGFASAHKNYFHYFYHSTSQLNNRLSNNKIGASKKARRNGREEKRRLAKDELEVFGLKELR